MSPLAQRVLCVDDDPATLKLRRFLLESAGYGVSTAASAEEALAIAAADSHFALALLDYRMPGMNGDELAQKLRQAYPTMRLMAVSAVGQLPPSFLQAVDSQVQKGHDPETLLAAIAKLLALPENSAGHKTASPRTVLCVEDDPLELRLRKLLLESAGFLVLQARSGGTALELFKSHHVDAVVMDYWLADRNGTSVAEEMKLLHPRTPIVMLSGYSALPGEGMMVDTWLRKAQVEPEEIVDCVEHLIHLRSGESKGTQEDTEETKHS